MPQISYRANLSSATFPMTLAKSGRSVIIPGPDQNFDKRVDAGGNDKSSVGIPQAIYMENVLPTSEGYQSVVYIPVNNCPITGLLFDSITLNIANATSAANPDGPIQFIGTSALGFGWCNYPSASVAWIMAIGLAQRFSRLSTANVRGVTYLFGRGVTSGTYSLFTADCVTANSPQITFTDISGTLTGIVTTDFHFICSSFNYLIAVSNTGTVYWSSTTTPTDFAASLVSGAGSEIPTGIRSEVISVTVHPTGFFIYTQTNVISALYTGNAKYPWRFVEIKNSLGVTQGIKIAAPLNSVNQICITASGTIQSLIPTEATLVAQEASNFLGRSSTYDTFNYATNVFSLVQNSAVAAAVTNHLARFAKIYFFHNRYIIISYGNSVGLGGQPFALVFDTLLQRYGKFAVEHHVIFSDDECLTFMNQETGECFRTAWTIYAQDVDGVDTQYSANGVLVLGKFQYVRSNFIGLEEIEIESVQDLGIVGSVEAQNFELRILPTLDGKTFLSPVTPYLTDQIGSLLKYNCHVDCKNFAVVLKGAFEVNTVELKFFPSGDN